MRKMLAVLMTLVMLCCAGAYAETAETTIPEVVFDETAAAFEGVWVNFDDDGFKLYLPTDWVETEPTEEMVAAGTYYSVSSADGAYAMTVSYVAEVGVLTNDEIAAQLTAEGYESVTQVIINGIGVVGYDITEQDVSGIAIADGEGGMYIISFAPVSAEAYAPIISTILSSLSVIE